MARDAVKRGIELLRETAEWFDAQPSSPFERGYAAGLRIAANMMAAVVGLPRGAPLPQPSPPQRWAPPPSGGGEGEGFYFTCGRCDTRTQDSDPSAPLVCGGCGLEYAPRAPLS
jgi:hypothetical protein